MESILDQVMTSKHMDNLKNFNPHQILEKILEALAEREQEIIRMRHGLADYEKKTLEDIGRKYNVTRERVRQIEAKAMEKLRLLQEGYIFKGNRVVWSDIQKQKPENN